MILNILESLSSKTHQGYVLYHIQLPRCSFPFLSRYTFQYQFRISWNPCPPKTHQGYVSISISNILESLSPKNTSRICFNINFEYPGIPVHQKHIKDMFHITSSCLVVPFLKTFQGYVSISILNILEYLSPKTHQGYVSYHIQLPGGSFP